MSGRHVSAMCGVLQQNLPLTGIQLEKSETGPPVKRVPHDREQHSLPRGKPDGQTVA